MKVMLHRELKKSQQRLGHGLFHTTENEVGGSGDYIKSVAFVKQSSVL